MGSPRGWRVVPDEGEELAAWLASTPNRVAYLRLKGAWARSGRLGALSEFAV